MLVYFLNDIFQFLGLLEVQLKSGATSIRQLLCRYTVLRETRGFLHGLLPSIQTVPR
jgi:hypothetical protein